MNEVVQQFKHPIRRYRPKMRWWLPGAFMSNEEIKREIEWMADKGYGGAEIIHFFGIPSADVNPEDYGNYGFGSDEWNDRMKAALEAAIPLDFQLDFTVGPLWPIATPAITDQDDDRCTQGLHVGVVSFDKQYNGPIPESETIDTNRQRKLVAVTVARKHAGNPVGKQMTLDLETAKDITSAVSADCILNWVAPTDGEWCIFSYWSQTNGQMNDSAGAPVVDHFSKAAAETVIGFWEEGLFADPEIKALYEKNAGALFCDSIELNATMMGGMYGGTPMPVAIWSTGILEEFRNRRGYDLIPYLPSIFIKGLYQLSERKTDGDSEYDFSDRAVNRRIRNDFFLTLTEMFRDNHLRVLREWTNSHNMKLRYQTYGMPTELTAGLLEVDIPETESLGFADSIDGYRAQSGAVHMAGRDIYSIEVGAVMGYGYKQTWTDKDFGLLWQLHRGFAGGVNQAVLHGMSYETQSVVGHFADSFQWPGMSLMGTMFSNEWGKRQPNSIHTNTITDYIARNQAVLQIGKAKVDLAIYRYHIDGAFLGFEKDLTVYEKFGFTFDYVSHHLLELENAKVDRFDNKQALAADGPAYQALIIDMRRNTDNGEWMPSDMDLGMARRLIEYAEAGLPIVIVGEGPKHTISYQGDPDRMNEADYELQRLMKLLHELPTVKSVSNQQDAIEALERLSVVPAARTAKASQLVTVRRYENGSNYYFIYNSSLEETFTGEISLQGKGYIYKFNAWNGTIQALAGEQSGSERMLTKLQIAPNATSIIVVNPFMMKEGATSEISSSVNGGKRIQLDQWSLHVQSWTPGSSPTETKIETIDIIMTELKSWTELPELQNVSGIGHYRTVIHLDETTSSYSQAQLELGEVSDTYQVKVNNQVIFNCDQIDRRIMVGEYLRIGENVIEIEVATTLNNALLLFDTNRQPQQCGLVGPVVLTL